MTWPGILPPVPDDQYWANTDSNGKTKVTGPVWQRTDMTGAMWVQDGFYHVSDGGVTWVWDQETSKWEYQGIEWHKKHGKKL